MEIALILSLILNVGLIAVSISLLNRLLKAHKIEPISLPTLSTKEDTEPKNIPRFKKKLFSLRYDL